MRVLRESAHERQIDVHMRVDEAGEHVFALGIDDRRLRRRFELRADAGDLLALAIDVRSILFARGNDTAIFDEE